MTGGRPRERGGARKARAAAILLGGALAAGAIAWALTREGEVRRASPAQLVWFYRPPSDGTPVARLAASHASFILTGRSDAPYKARLREAGSKAPVWQYLEQPFTSAPLDGPCGTFPNAHDLWDNQVAWNHEPGVAASNDFCRHIDGNEDWLLHGADGARRVRRYGDQVQYYMDPGSEGWRAFFAERVRWALAGWRYDGIFLDDLWNHTARHGGFREYATDEAYERAVVGFVESLRLRVPGIRVIGNAEEPAAYSAALDGWLYEAFAAHWSNGYQPPHDVVALWRLAQRDAAAGKHVFLVAQGEREDVRRMAFAYGAYLMVAGPNVYFRYTHRDRYAELWSYPEYELPLGEPTGPRRAVGRALWRRDFEGGTVLVNLGDTGARVRLERPYTRPSGEPVEDVELRPQTAALLLRAEG